MKGKYITTDILMACLSKKPAAGKDIHQQLKETIDEYKAILEQSREKAAKRNKLLSIHKTQAA